MAAKDKEEIQIPAVFAEMQLYVPVIHRMMEKQGLRIRDLVPLTRISRSRLGRILHHDPEKRSSIQLAEFLSILHALGVQVDRDWIGLMQLKAAGLMQEEEGVDYSTFLIDFAEKMPEMVKEYPILAGVPFRKEWTAPLITIMLKRAAKAEAERQHRERHQFDDDK